MTVKAEKKEFLSVSTPDGQYRYVFLYNADSVGNHGLPRSLEHKLIGTKTGGTVVPGGFEVFAPNATREDVIREMLSAMRNVSAKMFFKQVARKPHLIDAWKEFDLEALREEASRYVSIEECINAFFSEVMKTERLVRRPSEVEQFYRKVSSTENLRANFNDVELRVTRRMSLLFTDKSAMRIMLSYSLTPPAGLPRNDDFDVRGLSFTNNYSLAEWPSLNRFFNDPTIKPVIEAWIEHTWTPEMKEAKKIEW